MIFEPLTIGNVTFKNRLVRSSIGGRSAYYDGTVNNAWKNFEFRFRATELAALSRPPSTSTGTDGRRLEYPQISDDKFVRHLAEGIRAVQSRGLPLYHPDRRCRLHTQTSLFSQHQDQLSSSSGFDLLYGYRTTRSEMTIEDIEQSVAEFGRRRRRVTRDRCGRSRSHRDQGLPDPPIPESRHQPSNRSLWRIGDQEIPVPPGDHRGGRRQVGPDFLIGVRISAHDYNYLPVNLRLPPSWRLMKDSSSATTSHLSHLREMAEGAGRRLPPHHKWVRLHQSSRSAR